MSSVKSPVMDVVKGTSVVMQEFSPGKPEPTPIEELRQQTTDVERDFLQSEDQRSEAEEQQDLDIDVAKAAMQAQIEEEVNEQAEELQEMLDGEISEGLLDVETEDTKIIIRIQEKGSFPSGRGDSQPRFLRSDLKDNRCYCQHAW